jgi:hypothetical protein
MKNVSIPAALLAVLLAWGGAPLGSAPRATALPDTLIALLQKRYPGYKCLASDEVPQSRNAICRAEHPSQLKADFNADGRDDYAILLQKAGWQGCLLLVALSTQQGWTVELPSGPDGTVGPCGPKLCIELLPPGEYAEPQWIQGEAMKSKTHIIKTPGIFLHECDEHDGPAYYRVGDKWEKGNVTL